jgi:hypothetical protein
VLYTWPKAGRFLTSRPVPLDRPFRSPRLTSHASQVEILLQETWNFFCTLVNINQRFSQYRLAKARKDVVPAPMSE